MSRWRDVAQGDQTRIEAVMVDEAALTDTLRGVLDVLGPKDFMRGVAQLLPLDLDKPEDAAAYVGYLIERGVLKEVGTVHHDHDGWPLFSGTTPSDKNCRYIPHCPVYRIVDANG